MSIRSVRVVAANPTLPTASRETLRGGNFTYHVVKNPDNGTAIMAMIVPQDGVILSIYLKYGNMSNQTFYDDVQMIPNSPSSGRDPHFYMASQNTTALNGTYYIGIQVNSSK
jgi:hypothetical protein